MIISHEFSSQSLIGSIIGCIGLASGLFDWITHIWGICAAEEYSQTLRRQPPSENSKNVLSQSLILEPLVNDHLQ